MNEFEKKRDPLQGRPVQEPAAGQTHGMPPEEYPTLESIAASIGIPPDKLLTCAEMNGVHPEGPDGTYTRTQADHLRAVCSLGPTLGP
jgi:hypothetical protein